MATRYYIGQVKQQSNTQLYADQRSFLSALQAEDGRISVHLGRLEPRPTSNPAADELASYLGKLRTRIDATVYQDLVRLSQRHQKMEVFVEKAVDVMVAVDMVMLAVQQAFDAAYLLSSDGDFTPAVEAVRQLGKRVYAASPGQGFQIAQVANSFVRLTPAWFSDCI